MRAGLPRAKSAKDLGWARCKGTTALTGGEELPEQRGVSGQEGVWGKWWTSEQNGLSVFCQRNRQTLRTAKCGGERCKWVCLAS